MSGTTAVKAPSALLRVWHRWTSVVAGCAARTGATVNAKDYLQLHGELIEALRLAAVKAAPIEQEFYDGLKDLVRPWLTLTALTQTDGAILGDLLRSCRDAQRRLRGRKPALHWDGRMSVAAIALIALLLVVAIATFSLDWWPRTFTEVVFDRADRVRQAWLGLSRTYQIGIAAVVAAPFALVLLRRLLRR